MKFNINNFNFKEKGHLVSIGVCGLISCGLLMGIVSTKEESATIQKALHKKKQALKQAGETQIATESLGDIKGSTRAISVARFTGELESLSRNQSVGLSQLTVESVTRPAPGLPPSTATWIESDVSFTVQGSTANIYGFVGGLKTSTAKFRILEINLTPLKENEAASPSGVSAVIRLALLMKSGTTS